MAQTASAYDEVQFDEIKLKIDDDNMDLAQDLVLKITFKDVDFDDEDIGPGNKSKSRMEFTIEIDGTRVHFEEDFELEFTEGEDYEYTIDSDKFKDEDEDDRNLWNALLMAYDCGDHDVTVRVSDGDLMDDYEADDNYEMGGDAAEFGSVSLSMENPTLEDQITIEVTNEDGDEYDDRADMRITWLSDKGDKNAWDQDDDAWSKYTKSDGTREVTIEDEFSSKAYGAYRLDVWDEDPEYCLHTIIFNVSNSLRMSAPMPESPKVGQAFKVNVTRPDGAPAIGVTVTVSGPGTYTTGRTGIDGSVSFTFNTKGTYTLSAGDDGTYDLVMRTVTLDERPVMSVSATPESVNSGKAVEILVKNADGDPVSDATITIVRAGDSRRR
ncbi:MAG: carboxypeptidase-like regulatory domain-containing protein [Candidatus Altiarchaeota archaeon]